MGGNVYMSIYMTPPSTPPRGKTLSKAKYCLVPHRERRRETWAELNAAAADESRSKQHQRNTNILGKSPPRTGHSAALGSASGRQKSS